MSGINFTQLRTVTNPGLEGSGATDAIQVKAATGISLDASGVGIDTGSNVSFSGAVWTFGAAGELNVTGAAFSGTQVPNADWVASQIATGVSWGYPVLDAVQLDDTGDGAIRQAAAFYLVNDAAVSDTFRITDGSTTETWTAVAGAPAAFQFTQGTSVSATMVNLAEAISGDSTLWNATVATGLNSINGGTGEVIVIARTTQATADDRIMTDGTANATPADWKYVNFNGEDGYTNNTSTNLPSTDPAQKEFGPGKLDSVLVPGEAHVTLNGDSQYVWDADGTAWTQISGTGSITAGAGLTKSGNTIDINSGTGTLNGISVVANAIGLALGSSGGLKLTTNELFIEPGDFAGTGLEDDGSDNLRIAAAAAGNGITGGGGSALAVQADGTTGGNVEPANVTANGVGVNIANIAGTGLEADGSANLRIAAAAAGAGLTGGAGSALAVDGTEANMKTPVRVRTTTNVNVLATNSPDAVDGITMAVGDRILIGAAEQTTDSECGIYEVTILGAGVDDATWVRTADAPATSEAAGWYIQVLEGSTHGDGLFRVDADKGGATTGTDGWSLATFSGADTTRSAGDGLVDGTGLNLDVDPDSTTGGNMLPVSVSSDGVGVDISAITGTGIEADGSANLRLATQGNGIAGGGGSTLSVDPATEVAGSRAAVYVGADGVGIELDNSTLTHSSSTLAVASAGITETHLNTSVAGDGLTGGGGTALAVNTGAGIAISADAVVVDTASTVTFLSSTAWTYPNGVTAEGLFVTGTPVDANHAVNKTYVDNQLSGLTWLAPGSVLEYLGTRTVTEINALTPDSGHAVVAGDAGTPTAGTSDLLAAGDIAEYDGTSWLKIVSHSGGFPPDGTRAVVAYPVGETLYSPLTDGSDEGKIAEWDGTSLTPALTTPNDGDAILINGEGSVNENAGFVYDGTVPSGAWNQFTGAGQVNAGTGMTKSGNTLNVNATAVTNTNPTILAQADSIEVKYEAAGAGVGGLTDVAAGLRVNVEAAGAAAGGLELVAGGLAVIANTAAGIELTASGLSVDLEAAGAATGGLAFDSGEIRVNRDVTSTGAVASVVDLNANGVAIRVDDSTLEGSAAGGSLRVKALGIDTAELAADSATVAKLGVSFRQDEFAAAAFTYTTLSTLTSTLSKTPLVGTKGLGFIETLRNGVADMARTAGAPTTATEYRVTAGPDKLEIGTDITATGNTYRVYYLSADLTA